MQRVKKALVISADIIFTLMLLVGVTMIALRLFGFKLLAVETGSMGESYPVGSLLLVSEKEPEQIKVGDVISFVANEELLTVTHRVVAVGEEFFYTKGDMNNVIDSPVYFENLIGRVEFSLPKLGYAVIWSHTLWGKVVIACGLMLISLGAAVGVIFNKTERRESHVGGKKGA